ncbi:MAG: type II toxin-antitoxin system VapC family toxin [Solirubrobacterales bacterium]
MAVVVDTSILIDHLRGVDAARKLLSDAGRARRGVAASVLTKTELIVGAHRDDERRIQQLFAQVYWVPVVETLADQAGSLVARFKKSHRGIELVDYVIAATAIALDAPLLTRNVKHFPMFEGLQSPY